jgi:hypothetical protein
MMRSVRHKVFRRGWLLCACCAISRTISSTAHPHLAAELQSLGERAAAVAQSPPPSLCHNRIKTNETQILLSWSPQPAPQTLSSMQSLLEFANAFARPRLAYSHLVITEEVEAELLRNFFGPGWGLVDLSVESPLPASWVNEIRRFFPQRCDQKQFFAVEDLMQCMYDIVACYCSKSKLIQQFGNAKFRQLLRQAFISATSKPQLVCCAEADSRLLAGGEDIINDAAQQLTSVELDKSARAPLVGSDILRSDLTTADAVSEFEMLSEVRRVYNEGPLPLLQWDEDTNGLVDSIIGELFASEDPANRTNSTSPQDADHELHAAFLAHFSGRAFSRDEVRAELQFASSAVCLSYLGGPIRAYLRRKLDSLYRGIAVSLPFVVPIPFPGLEQAPPFPADVASKVTRWPISFTSAEGTTHWLEFIQRNFYASFEPFLDRGEMPHVVGMYRERVATEHNRCFFIHLGAALGVHPVWLQVILECTFFGMLVEPSTPLAGVLPASRETCNYIQ